MDIELENNKIKDYLYNYYGISSNINKDYLDEDIISFTSGKYDFEIKLKNDTKKSFLKGKPGISFNYNASKKYRNELNWHGGGYMSEYKNNYDEIDKFLKEFDIISTKKQLTIFDF